MNCSIQKNMNELIKQPSYTVGKLLFTASPPPFYTIQFPVSKLARFRLTQKPLAITFNTLENFFWISRPHYKQKQQKNRTHWRLVVFADQDRTQLSQTSCSYLLRKHSGSVHVLCWLHPASPAAASVYGSASPASRDQQQVLFEIKGQRSTNPWGGLH